MQFAEQVIDDVVYQLPSEFMVPSAPSSPQLRGPGAGPQIRCPCAVPSWHYNSLIRMQGWILRAYGYKEFSLDG